MLHSSNGSHRRIAIEEPSASSDQAESATARIDSTLGDMQEVVRTKSTELIRQYPGASLLLAVAVGGVIGWLIKRRG